MDIETLFIPDNLLLKEKTTKRNETIWDIAVYGSIDNVKPIEQFIKKNTEIPFNWKDINGETKTYTCKKWIRHNIESDKYKLFAELIPYKIHLSDED